MDGNYFDCTGYGQTDRFVKTVEKIAIIALTYKGGGITHKEVMTQTVEVISPPQRPSAPLITRASEETAAVYGTVSPLDVIDYSASKKKIDMELLNQKENHQTIYGLVWQHCTDPLKSKVKSHSDYASIESSLNGIELLKIVKLICFDIEDEKYIPQKVHESKEAYYALRQGATTLSEYYTRFKNQVTVIEQCGASIGSDPLIRKLVCKDFSINEATTDTTELTTIQKETREYTLAVALILGADMNRYGNMITDYKNAHLAGRDEWPKNLVEAYSRLSKWESNTQQQAIAKHTEGLSFATDDGKDHYVREPKPWHKNKICRLCGIKGHVGPFCEATDEQKKTHATAVAVAATTAATNLQATVPSTAPQQEAAQHVLSGILEDEGIDYEGDMFLQHHETMSAIFQIKDGVNGGRIPKSWVLIDNQSTAHVYSNGELLTNIREVTGSLTIHTQTGKGITKMKGDVIGVGPVWYHPGGIANILSLALIGKQRLVTFNSRNGNTFEVTRDDGSIKHFVQSEHGLYYYDMTCN